MVKRDMQRAMQQSARTASLCLKLLQYPQQLLVRQELFLLQMTVRDQEF
jgi:hypothetical protein